MELLYITWSGDLIGIPLGFFTIRFYSLTFLAAFLLGWVIMSNIFDKDGEDKKLIDPLFMYTFIATILGARLGHVIFYQPELFQYDIVNVFLPFRTNPEFEFTGYQGLASHGAAIALFISTYLFSRNVIKKHYLWMFDRLSITLALAGFFIRIGNFLNSEIVGKYTESALGVRFLKISSDYQLNTPVTLLHKYEGFVPRHPAQLYEAFGYLLLFVIMWSIYNFTNKKNYKGFLFGVFLIGLFAVRFVVEFVKEPQGIEDLADFIDIGLNNGQLLSIPFIVIGLIYLITSKNRKIKA
jgi:phosphatidylglycerol:prolipoprotein diacylglycerol transferase